MTDERDFDRLYRAWLDLMPSEAPDRAVATVLEAVESTPQVRRPLDVLRRSSPMNRFYLATALAAVVVVAVLMAVTIRPSLSSNVGASVDSLHRPPSPGPTHGTGDLPIPAQLLGYWLGSHHDVTGLDPDSGAVIHIARSGIGLSQSNHQNVRLLSTEGTEDGDGRIHLATSSTDTIWAEGDTGTYTWTLSPSGQTLTLTSVEDTCAIRGSALTGTWWLDDCKAGPCFGAIDAGTYGSEYFEPRLRSQDAWKPRFGALTFTITDGWAVAQDLPGAFRITPADSYDFEGPDGPPDRANYQVSVYTEPRRPIEDGTCGEAPDTKAGRTVDDLARTLSDDRALSVSELPQASVGGHQSTVFDIRLAAGWTKHCPDLPASHQYLSGTQGWGATETYWYGAAVVGTERNRLFLVDIGNGDVVAIVIDVSDPTRFDALVAAATPIIQSFEFK